MALIIGAIIGLLSGLVGVGGGIFLTPVLLLMHWSETKTAAGVSALFILVNSIAGLAGTYSKRQLGSLPTDVWFWIGGGDRRRACRLAARSKKVRFVDAPACAGGGTAVRRHKADLCLGI